MQIESDIDIDTFATAQNNLLDFVSLFMQNEPFWERKKARTFDAHNWSAFIFASINRWWARNDTNHYLKFTSLNFTENYFGASKIDYEQ